MIGMTRYINEWPFLPRIYHIKSSVFWYMLLAKITKKLMMTCTNRGKETVSAYKGHCVRLLYTVLQKDVFVTFLVAFYQTYCMIRKHVCISVQ